MLQFMRSQRLGHLRNGNSKKELKILEVKKTITDMKNEYDGLIDILDTAEERISVLDVLFVETSKTEKQREKREKEMQIKTTMRYHLTPGRMPLLRGASLVVQWLRLHAPLLTKKKRKENFMLSMQGAQTPSLVRELRFHKLEIRVCM